MKRNEKQQDLWVANEPTFQIDKNVTYKRKMSQVVATFGKKYWCLSPVFINKANCATNFLIPCGLLAKPFRLSCYYGLLCCFNKTNRTTIAVIYSSATQLISDLQINKKQAYLGPCQKSMRYYSFSTYAKFFKKLKFLTPWQVHVRISR